MENVEDFNFQYFQDRTEYGSYDPIFPGYEEVEKLRFPIFPGDQKIRKSNFQYFQATRKSKKSNFKYFQDYR